VSRLTFDKNSNDVSNLKSQVVLFHCKDLKTVIAGKDDRSASSSFFISAISSKMQPITLCWRCAVTMGLQIGATKVSVCETSPASSCIPALNSWISLWALDFASLIFAKFRVIVYSIESLPKRLVQKRLPSSDIFVAQI